MSLEAEPPRPVFELLRAHANGEFATVSSAGVPIDTPMLIYANADVSAFSVATGLSYPSKAERARKNPKVGLLFEGHAHEPVIAVAGRAAVRDSNLQANLDSYLEETAFARVGPAPWPLARKAVWYWTRMIVEIKPVRIWWWENPASMDAMPKQWKAPANTVYPASDPAPPGAISAPLDLPQKPWQEQARSALERKAPGHLTVCDADGYPLPIRARTIKLTDTGFRLVLPKGVPWTCTGKCTFTFEGRATFVGDAKAEGGEIVMRVERALPVHPLVGDNNLVWEPSQEVYEGMMRRLTHECARRGQPIPSIPDAEPEPSPGAKIRLARLTTNSSFAAQHGFKDAMSI